MSEQDHPRERISELLRRDQRLSHWKEEGDHFLFTGEPSLTPFALRTRWEINEEKPFPEGMLLWHHCEYENCAARGHIEPVTRAEFSRRYKTDYWGEEEKRWQDHLLHLPSGHTHWAGKSETFWSNGGPVRVRRLYFEKEMKVTLSENEVVVRDASKCNDADCINPHHMKIMPADEQAREQARSMSEQWGPEEERWKASYRTVLHPDYLRPCMIWKNDRLVFVSKGEMISARRRAWFDRHQEEIPRGEVLLPKCGCPRCIEPDHMERISRSEWERRRNAELWQNPTLCKATNKGPRERQPCKNRALSGKDFCWRHLPKQEVRDDAAL